MDDAARRRRGRPAEAPNGPQLPKIPLLSSLNATIMRYVIEMSRCATRPGRRHHAPGRAGRLLCRHRLGAVQVVAEGPAAARAGRARRRAFFGELALLKPTFPRSATVIAADRRNCSRFARAHVGNRAAARCAQKTLLPLLPRSLLDRLLASSDVLVVLAEEAARLCRKSVPRAGPGCGSSVEGERAPGMFLSCAATRAVAARADRRARLAPGDISRDVAVDAACRRRQRSWRDQCWTLELPRERFQEIMRPNPQIARVRSATRRQAPAGRTSPARVHAFDFPVDMKIDRKPPASMPCRRFLLVAASLLMLVYRISSSASRQLLSAVHRLLRLLRTSPAQRLLHAGASRPCSNLFLGCT